MSRTHWIRVGPSIVAVNEVSAVVLSIGLLFLVRAETAVPPKRLGGGRR